MQAAAQLNDTTVKLFKIGEEGVPSSCEYIKDTLSDGGVIGFDGRVVSLQGQRHFMKSQRKQRQHVRK